MDQAAGHVLLTTSKSARPWPSSVNRSVWSAAPTRPGLSDCLRSIDQSTACPPPSHPCLPQAVGGARTVTAGGQDHYRNRCSWWLRWCSASSADLGAVSAGRDCATTSLVRPETGAGLQTARMPHIRQFAWRRSAVLYSNGPSPAIAARQLPNYECSQHPPGGARGPAVTVHARVQTTGGQDGW
jgi:hypothetical protein